MTVARRAGIPPFYVMDVWLAAAERQRTHGDLVNLSAGQPSVGAPAPVLAAAEKALRSGPLGYTVALGIPELRQAIAGSYAAKFALDVGIDDVVLTTGSSGGFLLAFLACFDAGDRVAIASPGYPCYRNILSALGCEVVEIECGPETRFQPTVDMLDELDPPVQGVIVASPANPTGAGFLSSRLRRLDWRTSGPPTDGGVTAAGPDKNPATDSEPPPTTAPTELPTGRAALGGAGHTAARAAAQAATLRALARRTSAIAAETAARDAAIHAARGIWASAPQQRAG